MANYVYSNWDKKDEARRTKDEKQEKIIGDFLDSNFYPQFTTTITRNYQKATQVLGLDVTITSTNNNNYTIDEKAAVQWANRNLKTFALEIDSLNKNGDLYDGWFISGANNKNCLNKYWLFVWVDSATTADFTCTEQIQQLTVSLIKKRDVYEWFLKNNINSTKLKDEAKTLRQRNAWNNNYFYTHINNLKLMIQREHKEHSINILVPRQTLVDELATYSAVVTKNNIEPIRRRMGV